MQARRPLRILFAFVGGHGHFLPLVPLARAAAAAGHDVTFSSGSSMVDAVAAAGFDVAATVPGQPPEPERQPATAPTPPTRVPLLPVDLAREERDLRERFVLDGARSRAAGVLDRAAAWRPDVIVCDEVDFGSIIAAERLGLPYATVNVLAAGGMIRPDVVGDALDEVRAEHGLPPDPTLAALTRYLVLIPGPASLRDPADPLPVTARGYRAVAPDLAAAAAQPPWPITRPGQPALYVTLGTIFNLESGDLFDRVLAGVRDWPGDVVMTVGEDLDPTELGPQPDHIHLHGFTAQAAVLPHVSLVVSHGGSGSVLGALAHGLPMVILAMGADQPRNAARCAALGVARSLDPLTATPAEIGTTIAEVEHDPAYRQAAARLGDEMAALPSPAAALAEVEHLVR
jgi:UDP:flavonoid glycosyltransferase YjiC (YdhE family)